jgi:hypothetical protein
MSETKKKVEKNMVRSAPVTPAAGAIVKAAQQAKTPSIGLGDYLLGSNTGGKGVYDDVTVFMKKEMPQDAYAGELGRLKSGSGETSVNESGDVNFGSSGAHQMYSSAVKDILNKLDNANVPIDIGSATAAVKSIIDGPASPKIFQDLKSSGVSLANMIPSSASSIADIYIRNIKKKREAQNNFVGPVQTQAPSRETIESAKTQTQAPAGKTVRVKVTKSVME